jgi:hypothetical protein
LAATVWGLANTSFLDVAMLAANLACFIAWIRGFSRVGEFPPPPALSPEEAAVRRMLRQTILQRVKKAGGEDFQRL